MTTVAVPTKRPRGKRRELAPLEPIDAQFGPKMLALPSDKHRVYVLQLYEQRPGHGASVRAARAAGFGTETSTPQSMATIASRLAHDERVLEAIHEEDRKRIRASAPRAIRALSGLIENPEHRDHARGIAMVLDRVHPVQTEHKVTVDHRHVHRLTTAELDGARERIKQLAARAGMPEIVDAEFAEVKS